jgi:hypothetical protein
MLIGDSVQYPPNPGRVVDADRESGGINHVNRATLEARRKGRDCYILESAFSNPNAQGYIRVKSWVDIESGGILQAEAFDRQGKKIKEFALTGFEKIEGQWHLKEMEIRNLKNDSRTRLEFELTVE